MTTHHVCLSCSLHCSGANACRECRNLIRKHVTVPALEAAGVTNAQAERFMAASEACLVALHEEMQKDPTLAAIALDLTRVERAMALLAETERAAAAATSGVLRSEEHGSGGALRSEEHGSGRLMDPRSAMAYMDDVARRVEAVATASATPVEVATPQAQAAVDPSAEAEAGPSTAEHAAALITRELLSNPALLQSVLATGIVAAQAAAMAAQSEAETQPEMEETDDEALSSDEAEANPEDAPPSPPPPPPTPTPAAVRQEPPAAPRAAARERPMDISDIMAAGESVSDADADRTSASLSAARGSLVAEDELLPQDSEDLNGSASLALTDRASSPGDHTGVEETPPPLSS